MGLAPPRMEAFCWLAIAGKISTTDNLRRRGLLSESISDICCLCRRKRESIDHLFIHCEIALTIWGHFLKRMRCGMVPPGFPSGVVRILELSSCWVRTEDMETHSLFGFVVYLETEE